MGRRVEPGEAELPARVVAGRYRLTGRQRGAGYEGVDLRSGVPVLVEGVPLPEVVGPFDQQAVEPDGAAGKALAQAAYVVERMPDHPRLAQAFEVVEDDGRLWAVGELPPGRALGALLDERLTALRDAGATGRPAFSPYWAAELGHDVAAALTAVHRMGLVHGNVTPDTVTVCEDGTALLGGLVVSVAQEALCGGPGADEPGAAVPTALWSPARVRARDARAVLAGTVAERWAPEQAGVVAGAGMPVGPAADVWSLGVLLCRMVGGVPTARPPAQRSGDGSSPRRDAGGFLPPRGAGVLGPLLARMLEAEPGLRPTAAQVRAELSALLVRAPEPVAETSVLSVGQLLPGARGEGAQRGADPRAQVRAHPDFPHGRHAAGGGGAARRRGPVHLGPLLVGAVFLVMLLAVVVIVVTGG